MNKTDMKKPFNLSVKLLLLDEQGRGLFLKRSPMCKAHAGKWELPGGKLEPGEYFDQALLREVEEETGLKTFMLGVAGTTESDLPSRKIIYLILEGSVDEGTLHLSTEHEEAAWLSPADALKLDLAPQFRRFLEDYCRGKQHECNRR